MDFSALRCALCTTTLLLATSVAHAGIIGFGANQEFSGGTAPAGIAPWVTLTFEDTGPGIVTVTIAATHLTDSEFVSGFYFNVDPSLNADDLIFSAPIKTGSFDTPSIDTETNNFKADGDGYFDVLLSFATAGGLAERFTNGDSISYNLTMPGHPTFEAAIFDAQSAPGGGHGSWPMAAHVQSIGALGGSGWVSGPPNFGNVPEPASLGLLALAGSSLLVRRRKCTH